VANILHALHRGEHCQRISQKWHLWIKCGISFKASNVRSGACGRVGKINVYSIFGVPYQTDLLSCPRYFACFAYKGKLSTNFPNTAGLGAMQKNLCDLKHRIYGLFFANFPDLRDNGLTYVAHIGHAMLLFDAAHNVVQTRGCDGKKGYFRLERAVGLGRFCIWALSRWTKNCCRYPNAFHVGR